MTDLLPEHASMREAPIFFVSTHGHYDLEKEPNAFTVPPNTFVFETATVCDLTSTSIDSYLWDLMAGENRRTFLDYFMGKTNASDEDDAKYIQLFKNMHFYEPGDKLYVRTLELSGGRNENMLSTERSSYSTFGFYHFPVTSIVESAPNRGLARPISVIKTLEPIRNSMITGSTYTTNQTIITGSLRKFFSELGSLSIFVFSSCGELRCGRAPESECNRRVAIVESHQHAQDLKALAKGLRTTISPEETGRNLEGIPASKYGPGFAANEAEVRAALPKSPTKSKSVKENNNESDVNSDEFTYLDPNEDEHPLRGVPVKQSLSKLTNTFIVYKIQLTDPTIPFPITITSSTPVVSSKSLVNQDGSPYFTNRDIRKLLLDKKRDPEQYKNTRLYVFHNKRLKLLAGGFLATRKIKRKNKKRQTPRR